MAMASDLEVNLKNVDLASISDIYVLLEKCRATANPNSHKGYHYIHHVLPMTN